MTKHVRFKNYFAKVKNEYERLCCLHERQNGWTKILQKQIDLHFKNYYICSCLSTKPWLLTVLKHVKRQ